MTEFRNVNGYVSPALTADAVLLKGREVLLIRRAREPWKGMWALPGGFVDVGERVEEAARRELVEETGLRGDIVDLLGVWSAPDRDPRGHVVTVAFILKVSGIVDIGREEGEVMEARWFALDKLPELAADHDEIMAAAKRWLDAPGNFERLGDTDFGKCLDERREARGARRGEDEDKDGGVHSSRLGLAPRPRPPSRLAPGASRPTSLQGRSRYSRNEVG